MKRELRRIKVNITAKVMSIIVSPKKLRIFILVVFAFATVGAFFAIWFLNRDDNQVAPDDSAAGICCPSFHCNDDTRFGEDTNYTQGACSTRYVACDGHQGYRAGSDGDQCDTGGGDDGGDGGDAGSGTGTNPVTCNPNQAPWTTTGKANGEACCGGGVNECASELCSGTLGIVGECYSGNGECTDGRVYCGGCVESCVDLTGYGGCNEYIEDHCGESGSNPYCPGTPGSTCNSGTNATYGNNCDGSGNCTNPAGSSCQGQIHACDQGGGACINQVDSFSPGQTVNCIEIANQRCQYVQLDVVCDGSGNSAITCYPTNCTPGSGTPGTGTPGTGTPGTGTPGTGTPGTGTPGTGTEISCAIAAGLQCLDDGQIRVNWNATTNGFDVNATTGRVVVRINNSEDPWFTADSDIWWATNFPDFINSGLNPESAQWTFDVEDGVDYLVRVSLDPDVNNATIEGLCSTAEQTIQCDVPEEIRECGESCTTTEECRGSLVCDNNICNIPACVGEDCICTPPSEENPEWAIEKSGAYMCQENTNYADVEYEITIQNIGDVTGTLTEVVDTLDSEIQSSWVITSTISHGGVLNGNVITWDLPGNDGVFTAGETLTLSYTVRIPSTHFGRTFENNVVANPEVGENFTDDETVIIVCNEPLPRTSIFGDSLAKVGLGVFITSISLLFMMVEDSDKLLLAIFSRTERDRIRNQRIKNRIERAFGK